MIAKQKAELAKQSEQIRQLKLDKAGLLSDLKRMVSEARGCS